MAKDKKNLDIRNDELVNYIFRPAKNIERKMLCEALSRLSILSDIKKYQYVGFGSTYFADFTLFHKVLGIKKLISIEGDTSMETRVKFNIPYSCIEVKPGLSTEMLPEIDWKIKSILWLDYTESLKGYMFKDMAIFFNRAVSGSVFVISINVDLKENDVTAKTITEKIQQKLNKDIDVKNRIRTSALKGDLKKNNYYSILRGVIHQEITDILDQRNKTEMSGQFKYHQIFNFIYKDGQVMLTIGGILYQEKDSAKIIDMELNGFDFARDDDDYFEINVPNLTNREIRALDKYLPHFNTDEISKQKAFDALKGVVSDDAIEKYAKIYRYFPIFAESNV